MDDVNKTFYYKVDMGLLDVWKCSTLKGKLAISSLIQQGLGIYQGFEDKKKTENVVKMEKSEGKSP